MMTEQLAEGLYLEGLAVDARTNTVYCSDVVGGGILALKPDGSTESYLKERKWMGGLLVNSDGCVLASGAGGIMWVDPQSGNSGWLIDRIDGKAISGINEMVADGSGGIYFGTCDIANIAKGQKPDICTIYRLTVEGDVLPAASNIEFCNGIMLSEDQQHFYCNNTFHCSYRFDVQPDLSLGNRQVLVEKTDCDGMVIDAENNIWITGCHSSDIIRFDCQGNAIESFKTPAEAITQARFGGADLKDLYITTVSTASVRQLKQGQALTKPESRLYKMRSDIPGRSLPSPHFNLC